jgi:hypothetical protein
MIQSSEINWHGTISWWEMDATIRFSASQSNKVNFQTKLFSMVVEGSGPMHFEICRFFQPHMMHACHGKLKIPITTKNWSVTTDKYSCRIEYMVNFSVNQWNHQSPCETDEYMPIYLSMARYRWIYCPPPTVVTWHLYSSVNRGT